ncbi:MAG: tetratricopeptide repeat protein [Planctomycetota bacterium]
MSGSKLRYPMLDKFYQQFLTEENSADFIQSVARTYNLATLERLAQYGTRSTRRGAILAIGFLGSFDNNETVGRALNDTDRAVRMLADHGIRQIWQRQGTPGQQSLLQRIYRLVDESKMDDVIDETTLLIRSNPELGEAWSQRAIAYCAEGDFDAAIVDCREALNCNRFHFPAAIGLAHCCLNLDEVSGALAGFRLALNINPELDGVRRQVMKLERMLES